MDNNTEIELIPESFKQQLRRPSTMSTEIENGSEYKSSITPSLNEFLEELQSSPNYDKNLFQFWLYKTITKWASSLSNTNLFDIDEHNVIILWLNKIFLILEDNEFDSFENFLDYLLLDTKNLYDIYSIYGWDCLIPKSLNDEEMNENCEEEIISIRTNNTSTEYNFISVEHELFLKKLETLFSLTREYFGSDFSFEIIKTAVQTKYYYKIIEAPHRFYFPKQCFVPIKPKGKKKKGAAPENVEDRTAQKENFILPLKLSTDITEEFWVELNKDSEDIPKT